MTKKKKLTHLRPSKRPAAAALKANPAHPHVAKALAYCRTVITGKIPAGKFTRLACQRHLADLERSKKKEASFPYYFDPVQAERVCRFAESMPHVKGKWARRDPLNPRGNRLTLEGWQCFFIVAMFGWLIRGTERKLVGGQWCGLRRFKEADLWVARKNGKSPLAAVIGHWMLSKDEEPGAEVYCGAGTEKQAWEVFHPARQMCEVEPRLQSELGITVNAKSLHRLRGGTLAKFEPVIGKPGDGASPHCAIIDEYHEHATSEQFDTFKTGMVAREQPLLLVISTAGFNLAGPARDRWREGESILEGTIKDERRFVLIYSPDSPDEWTTEAGLRKANPNWGVSVNATTVLADQQEAMREANKQTAFKTKHLNLWVSSSSAFFNIEYWNKCHVKGLTREAVKGAPCYEAGDLASKVNLAAIAQVFPVGADRFRLFARYYSPHDTVHLPENQHLRKWAIQGWLTVTPGNIIDFDQIRDDIHADCKQFKVEQIALDPWQAAMLINELNKNGATAFELRQTVQMLSEPMKQLDASMRAGKLEHDGNPITAWCLANVVAFMDKKGNVYPNKDKPMSKQFIDGAVALIMAFSRAILRPPPPPLPGVFSLG